jgi:chorismate mutase
MTPDPISEKLKALRAEMDAIDASLAETVIERYRCAKAILAFKHKHNLPLHAPEREWRIIQRAVKAAHDLNFHEDSYIRTLWFIFLGHPFTEYYHHHFWTE